MGDHAAAGPFLPGPSFFEIVGDPPAAESQRPAADYQIVSPATSRRSICLSWRAGVRRTRVPGSVQVCIVNEAFVRTYLQGDRRSACASPSGRRVAQAPPVVREIVGVARQVKGRPNETEDLIQIYVPLAQDTAG